MPRKAKAAVETYAAIQEELGKKQVELQKAQKELEKAKEEDEKTLQELAEKIDLLCDEAGVFCGLYIDEQNLLNMLKVMMDAPEGQKVIRVKYVLLFENEEENKNDVS